MRQAQDHAQPGGWANGTTNQDDRPQQPDWATQQDEGPGGWAGTTQDDRPRQPDWVQDEPSPATWATPADQRPPAGWAAPQDDQSQSDGWPGRDESAAGAGGAGAMPQQQPNDHENGWGAAEPASPSPARAATPVPGDGPTPWGTPPENPPQWGTANPERPAVPDVEPWAPGEAWGRTEAEPAASRADNGWEPGRGDESPVYQPAPGPGISPANAVPLPPQEQRVPGASLAAAPPADYVPPPANYGTVPEQPAYAEQSPRDAGDAPAYEQEQAGWGSAGSRHEEPPSPAGPVVPAPRTSPESAGRATGPSPEGAEAASGTVSASASVPLASRVMPPADQAVRPTGATPPQPRVYGRPARPEPADDPQQGDPNGHWPDAAPRFDRSPDPRFDQAPEPQFDERPAAFGAAAPVAPASPAAPPAFPTGMPSFVDAPASDRPVNGVRPHGGADRPDDRFDGAAGGGAAVHAGGTAVHGAPGYGPAPMAEPGGAAFPPAPQQPGPAWEQSGPEPDQGRFDAFKPIAEPKTEAPPPKVRNGRVLAAVLVAAVLILAVPLGLLTLLGKIGGTEPAPSFDPAVGTCVKQSGTGAAAADCGEADAFTIVSKVDAKEKCADPAQPHVVLSGGGANRVLCLKPAGS
ncbi:hypothetical protein C1I99_28430 [Micromonospora deserti]|uniref:Uncharacterized protein n=2 Tax=Micromonospora deserti TaxID=2070366 RepID=A0A2W2CF13_9ACTN|nr:hypothetical protein C1I99_28430 [Micromonospora deserti]